MRVSEIRVKRIRVNQGLGAVLNNSPIELIQFQPTFSCTYLSCFSSKLHTQVLG